MYAKELLYQRLFGPAEAVTDLDDAAGDPAADAAAATPTPVPSSVYLRNQGEDAVEYAKRIFEFEFRDRIDRLLASADADTWAGKQRPRPISLGGAL